MCSRSMCLTRATSLLAATAIIAFLLVSPIADAAEIRTAAQQASEPKFVSAIENGKPAIGGLCVDIMRAIENVDSHLKFTGDQTWQPLARMEAGLAAHQIDVICGLLRTGVRASRYVYIDTPLFPVTYYLIIRADDDVQISDWADVRSLGDQGIILVINGFGILSKLDAVGGLRIDAGAYTSKSNFDKLLAGRGRFYYHRSPGIKAEIRNAGVEGKVKILNTPMHREQFYMVASKKLPHDTIERLSKAIAQLERNGELVKLFEKWDR